MTTAAMSDYERKVWHAAVERLNNKRDGRLRRIVDQALKPAKNAAGGAWNAMPGHEGLEEQILKALTGLKAVTFDPALRSVNATKVLQRHGVSGAAHLTTLDLRQLDRGLPGVRSIYTGLATFEGGASALAVTGAEVSATVSGGVSAAVAGAAIAVDAVSSMAIMGRIIGQVAAEYGYDVREPEEEAYALGVISIGTASTAAEKAAALSSIRRLTTRMMRRATWAELNQNALVKLIDQVFLRLGERLTKRKLAQAVPVAGVLLNAGLSAQMADATYRTARDVYRLRFLSEKYGIDPATWSQGSAPSDDDIVDKALDELDSAS
ncbi:MAG: EcsC family protein [Ornithinimicrobium sp.]